MQSVNTQQIIARCVAAHARGRTFHIIGVLKDYRPGKSRVVPVLWEYQRPSRCKLQIAMDVAVVLGEDCWIYTAERGRFTRHRRFSRTPMQTASYLLSDGLAMLLPELCSGNAAFGESTSESLAWQLDGVDWSSGRPCYVLSLSQKESDLKRDLILWIDQDDFLLRKWSIVVPGRNGTERLMVECDFIEVIVNSPLSEESFFLKAPMALQISQKATTQPGSP